MPRVCQGYPRKNPASILGGIVLEQQAKEKLIGLPNRCHNIISPGDSSPLAYDNNMVLIQGQTSFRVRLIRVPWLNIGFTLGWRTRAARHPVVRAQDIIFHPSRFQYVMHKICTDVQQRLKTTARLSGRSVV